MLPLTADCAGGPGGHGRQVANAPQRIRPGPLGVSASPPSLRDALDAAAGVAACAASVGARREPDAVWRVYDSGENKALYEQALVCLSNREIVDASSGRTFHCNMANNRFFL